MKRRGFLGSILAGLAGGAAAALPKQAEAEPMARKFMTESGQGRGLKHIVLKPGCVCVVPPNAEFWTPERAHEFNTITYEVSHGTRTIGGKEYKVTRMERVK